MCPELQFQKQGQDWVMTLTSIENQSISSPMIREGAVSHAYKYSGTVLGSPIFWEGFHFAWVVDSEFRYLLLSIQKNTKISACRYLLLSIQKNTKISACRYLLLSIQKNTKISACRYLLLSIQKNTKISACSRLLIRTFTFKNIGSTWE
jgi:hypothetical protein